MQRNILSGEIIEIESEREFNLNRDGGVRVKRGSYVGPGKYILLSYSELCPRGCCYDDVIEILPAQEAKQEIKEQMIDLAALLRRLT